MKRICLNILFAAAALSASAATKTWTGLGGDAKASTAANWDDSTAPVAGDAIVLDATSRDYPMTWDLDIPLASWTQDGYTNVVTIQTVYDAAGFDCLEIAGNVVLNSGVWTHMANSSAETYRLRVDVGGDMAIGRDAAINLTKKGYAAGKGPGFPGGHTGGAHGGQSEGANGVNSICYGSIASPASLGSGGEKYESQGGGALRLTIAGALAHNGAIMADGRTYRSDGTLATYYGAAGGSVWITAGSLSGVGSVSASSGTQSNNYYGGGGRVSLVLTGGGADFTSFTGEVKAASTYSGGYKAASGTVYYETAADGAGHGAVVVDGYNTGGGNYTDIVLDDQDAGFAPRRLVIGRKARVRITAGTRTTLAVTGAIILTNTATLVVGEGATLDYGGSTIAGEGSGAALVTLAAGAALVSNGALAFDRANLSIAEGSSVACGGLLATNGAVLTVNGDAAFDCPLLEIASGATLTDDAPLAVSGSVVVRAGGTVTHTANTATSDYRVQMSVGGSLTVESGAKVTAEAKGFPGNVGPGKASGTDRGANHGGVGINNSGTPNGNVCYGSLTRPTTFGSGTSGWAGGGSIAISCAGPVTNDGVVTAAGYSSHNSRVGPGGSVWITAASLHGGGFIQANAYGDSSTIARDNAGAAKNRSGGGRVAVWLTDPGADFASFTGVISAWGAGNSSCLGGAGTVYLKTGAQAANEGTLIIDNRYNADAVGNTEIGEDVTDTEVGSVVIGLGARVVVKDAQSLTVNGDFSITNAAGNTFRVDADSALVFAGRRPAAISADMAVAKFICQTPGKSLSFAAGSTVSVSELLSIEGAAASPVALGRIGGEGVWNLVLGDDASASVNFASVSDSDASGGQEVVAVNSTGTDTLNWRFENIAAGETVTWTGAESTSWSLAGNWDLGRAPIATDIVVIPGGPANQPTLIADTSCAELHIASGATLSLAGFNLSVSSDAEAAGLLVANGEETLVFGGDLDLSRGSFKAAASSVVLNGSAGQSFAAGGSAFHALAFANASGDGISISGAPTARTLTCAPAAATALSFADGASLSVSVSLTLAGASAAAPLSLLPATPGGAWQLRSLGIADISNVAVSNSTASANVLIASDSLDLGGNAGWLFGADRSTSWTGPAGGDWSEAANWSAGVPDAGTTAVIGGGAEVSVASAAEARSLRIGNATLTIGAPLGIAEALVAGDGATVVADKPVAIGAAAIIQSGATVTHTYLGGKETGGIDLSVGGDLVVEAGASISAKGKGGLTLGRSVSGGANCGGSHGGRSHRSGRTSYNPAYGSVYFPTNAGTSSLYSGNALRGGGVVRLRVEGGLTLDGTIDADGEDRDISYYSGSGGSVWITAGRVGGEGAVSANGGAGGSVPGSGGRVAIYLTDAGASLGASPTATAYGGYVFTDGNKAPTGSPGTIYVETAGDSPGKGVVRVANASNAWGDDPFADYPSTLRAAAGDGAGATWRLSGYSYLYVTGDAKVADVWLEGARPRIYLNGHKLKVRTFRHALGADEAVQVVPGGTEENPGQIIWLTPPTMLLLR